MSSTRLAPVFPLTQCVPEQVYYTAFDYLVVFLLEMLLAFDHHVEAFQGSRKRPVTVECKQILIEQVKRMGNSLAPLFLLGRV